MGQELDLLTQLCGSVKGIRADILIVKEIVTGNGDPDKGLVSRQIRLEGSVENCQKNNSSWRKRHEEASRISAKGRISIITAIITAITAIVVAGIALLK